MFNYTTYTLFREIHFILTSSMLYFKLKLSKHYTWKINSITNVKPKDIAKKFTGLYDW